MSTPKQGDLAPAFVLRDQNGTPHALSDFQGQWLVLYFYPKDNTPHCTAQACSLRDAFADLRRHGATVLGVSLDSEDSDRAFARQHALPFPLLSDQHGTVARQYGALWDFWLFKYAKRRAFLIAPNGRIALCETKVDVSHAAARFLAYLAESVPTA